MSYPAKLANLDVDRALNDLAGGKLLKQVAAEYGVDKTAIRNHLKTHPDYKQVIADPAHGDAGGDRGLTLGPRGSIAVVAGRRDEEHVLFEAKILTDVA